MSEISPSNIQEQSSAGLSQIQTTMTVVARRQGWLWFTAVAVSLLLTLCIATFAFPGLLSQEDPFYTFNLSLAVRALIGLVLLFNVYMVYQHLQIRRIQTQLTQQIGTLDRLDRVEERSEEAYKIAALDWLTGIYNRRSGEVRLAEEMARSKRHMRPLTVLMLDVNGLKKVNDTFGHAAGDLLLKTFGEGIQRAIRGSDAAIRLGGDEFLVLLPECKISEVQLVLNRLAGLKINYEQNEIPVEFAAGWTDYISGESSEALMVRVDKALYANKPRASQSRVVTETIVLEDQAR